MSKIFKKYAIITVVILIAFIGAFHLRPYLKIIPAEAANGLNIAAHANDPALKDTAPIIVELFTSQGCYSCPPAEAYLRDLAPRPDVIALEYHVDYWDDLVYGLAGKWKDPYSKPQFTYRQSLYNNTIRNRDQVYTPQMIINGKFQGTGSNRKAIERLIKQAKSQHSGITLSSKWEDGYLTASVNGTRPDTAELRFAIYHKRALTTVTSGENKGKELASYNIVHTLGAFPTLHDYVELSKPDKGHHCAVFLQDKNTLEIYASALCEGL